MKMDFTRKARWVKDDHKTPAPNTSAYTGVVSKEIVRTALTYSALMGLDFMAEDVQSAYLQAPSLEKHYVVYGAEFSKVVLIKDALYGGKVSGRKFWHHLRSCMDMLGFESCLADTDILRREATKTDGKEY